jgi:hypothetical protein
MDNVRKIVPKDNVDKPMCQDQNAIQIYGCIQTWEETTEVLLNDVNVIE